MSTGKDTTSIRDMRRGTRKYPGGREWKDRKGQGTGNRKGEGGGKPQVQEKVRYFIKEKGVPSPSPIWGYSSGETL